MSRISKLLSCLFCAILLIYFASGFWKQKNIITEIHSENQFTMIIQEAGPELIAFEVYTEWSLPSRILLPMLKEVARENEEYVTMYRLNLDNFPQLSDLFQSSSVPFVVFFKNQKAIHALTGVQPKSVYERVINMYRNTTPEHQESPRQQATPEGILIIRNFTNKGHFCHALHSEARRY
ncbi:MAG: thioredoxin family protein [Chitinispirillaceae bacterium]